MSDHKADITKLHTETPRKTSDDEVMRTWLKSNPGKKPADYHAFTSRPEWPAYKTSVEEQFKIANERWDIDRLQIPGLQKADTHNDALKTFGDAQTRGTYTELMDMFGDGEVAAHSNKWSMPSDALPAWSTLLSDTKVQVQRNATDLASVVASCRSISSEEVKQAKGDVKAWEASELFKVLQALEGKLGDWDGLLAADAFPDREKLKKAADECYKQFFQFYREHVPVYDADATIPYVKYQLLATMRSLAEKVASQLGTRAGAPSFALMYERVLDVPNRGKFADGSSTAERLKTSYSGDVAKACKTELAALGKELAKNIEVAGGMLDAELSKLSKRKPPADLEKSFRDWQALYKSAARSDLDVTLPKMLQASGEVAFGLLKYKEAVDAVLKGSPGSVTASYQDRYQALLNGFAKLHQEQVQLCKNLLKR